MKTVLLAAYTATRQQSASMTKRCSKKPKSESESGQILRDAIDTLVRMTGDVTSVTSVTLIKSNNMCTVYSVRLSKKFIIKIYAEKYKKNCRCEIDNNRFVRFVRPSRSIHYANMINYGTNHITFEFLDEPEWKLCHSLSQDKNIREVIRAVIKAIEFLHNEGYSHGDTNSKNIFIKRDGIKVIVAFIDLADMVDKRYDFNPADNPYHYYLSTQHKGLVEKSPFLFLTCLDLVLCIRSICFHDNDMAAEFLKDMGIELEIPDPSKDFDEEYYKSIASMAFKLMLRRQQLQAISRA